ncbi:hypothetical protein AC578_2990 [Pseudocercospora eumusae]|uniref:Uncharacterized protein n=1 Tax=Pseudocercospora eumusae TaxID=321146 RepID=A0A139GX60_9PEZI|nr:hypothetical protein AC578_2990 [Pseudocercospora eumusae]
MSQNFLAFSIIPEAVAHELCARAARELAASAPTSTRELCDHFQPTPAVVEIMTIVRQQQGRNIARLKPGVDTDHQKRLPLPLAALAPAD